MIQLPTNRTFTIKRAGVTSSTNLPALLEPPSTRSYQLLSLIADAPAVKLMDVYFQDMVDVQEQDQLVDQDTTTNTYRVRYVEQFDVPGVSYSFAIVEAVWGTN